MAAIARIEVRKNDNLLERGQELQTSHFEVSPTGDARLRWVYAVNPVELGNLLLDLGRKLGQPVKQVATEQTVPSALTLRPGKGGWMLASLTRLRFPPICCDCGQPTDKHQQFKGFRGLFSSDFSMQQMEDSVNIAAPVCTNCQAHNRRRWWRSFLKVCMLSFVGFTVLGVSVGIIFFLCGLPPGKGGEVPGILIASVGIPLSWVIAYKYAGTVSAPLCLKDYRPTYGTVQIRFRNRQYVETFLAGT